MTVSIFQYIFPVLVLSIVVVLLCFYLQAKHKRSSYDITSQATQVDNPSSVVHTISLEEDLADVNIRDILPPRYSTVDHPPPYSLFDPKLTNVWPGGPPPAYELYPITLPLAPHHWMFSTGPLPVTSPSAPSSQNQPPPGL
ncbi:hypothetical protein Q5P01_023717 [Channa striata]|uniref:Uncharacterized protein n=1 Tax=Channa striata TaxID=64152 RepID=A0AA88LLD6_CHASR|nr:hypothetical protein Q5P01_023717 [Channa striata]